MKNIYGMVIILLCTYHCMGQSGQLDPAWGGQGYTLYGNNSDLSKQLLIQPDGNIIACGYRRIFAFSDPHSSSQESYSQQILMLVRLHRDGTTDATFGINGKSQINSGLSNSYTFYPKYALQNDGKILISTSLLNSDSTALDFALYRINTNGTLDTSFGINGLVRNNIHATNNANIGLWVNPDGKIRQAGWLGCVSCALSQRYIVLLRYKSDGTRDGSYGTNGLIDSIRTGPVYEIQPRGQGKILLSSAFSPITFSINDDGTTDTTFHPLIANSFFSNVLVQRAVIAPDGGILLGYDKGYNPGRTIGLAKTLANGLIDSSFNGNGLSEIDLLKENLVKSIVVQPDGKILVLTQSFYYDTSIIISPNIYNYTKLGTAIVRFRASGQIDSSFATDGVFYLDTTLIDAQKSESLMLDADGRILCVGHGTTVGQAGILVFRLLNELSTGIVDFHSDQDQMEVYPNPLRGATTLKYELSGDEHLSIALYDMQGKAVQTIAEELHAVKGKHEQTFAVDENLPRGNYVIRIADSSGHGSGIKVTIR